MLLIKLYSWFLHAPFPFHSKNQHQWYFSVFNVIESSLPVSWKIPSAICSSQSFYFPFLYFYALQKIFINILPLEKQVVHQRSRLSVLQKWKKKFSQSMEARSSLRASESSLKKMYYDTPIKIFGLRLSSRYLRRLATLPDHPIKLDKHCFLPFIRTGVSTSTSKILGFSFSRLLKAVIQNLFATAIIGLVLYQQVI